MNTGSLLPGHYLKTHGAPNFRFAECQCGHELTWDTREEDHARHVMTVIWNQGYQARAQTPIGPGGIPIQEPTNPYEDAGR